MGILVADQKAFAELQSFGAAIFDYTTRSPSSPKYAPFAAVSCDFLFACQVSREAPK
jgi:hypothetical protein